MITTNILVARKALELPCGQECVDWAIAQLEAGVEHRSVTILAGMSAPFNPFEMADLRDRALAEVGAREVTSDEAVIMLAREIADDALHGRIDLIEGLKKLSDLCVQRDYHDDLMEFFDLHDAWLDVQAGLDTRWTLPRGVTRETIRDVVRAEMERFVRSRG